KLPFGNGYAVFAGLERIVNYIKNFHFSEEDIQYLATQEEQYKPGFLEELRQFKFTGDIYSVREGEIVFPNEPLIRVTAKVSEAQIIETALLNFVNYQTLVATKASRIVNVAPTDIFLEFGSRRAQEADAAIWGTRSAFIAGFHATSNLKAGQMFGIPAKGTHSHSWVEDFETEEEAFQKFADALPNNVTLLVDTYDTLKSGVPNAIKIAKELEQKGKRMEGIRLDSGDLAYLSIQARQMLDDAGLTYVKIVASSDLDEATILNLKAQGARVDIWGVGTKLITAYDQPALGGVYKLVAREQEGTWIPTIKISANPEKVTTPGYKTVYRIINRETGKAEGDYIAFADEKVDDLPQIKLFDPIHPYIHKFVTDYEAEALMVPIFLAGQQVYELPSLEEIRAYHTQRKTLFWDQYLRMLNPERYPVDLSQAVWDLKNKMIHEKRGL
ncbi:MAG: nicotinate phosphoribosyltransferase, partial [Tumebacillaceae bacterium]